MITIQLKGLAESSVKTYAEYQHQRDLYEWVGLINREKTEAEKIRSFIFKALSDVTKEGSILDHIAFMDSLQDGMIVDVEQREVK